MISVITSGFVRASDVFVQLSADAPTLRPPKGEKDLCPWRSHPITQWLVITKKYQCQIQCFYYLTDTLSDLSSMVYFAAMPKM